MSSEGRVWAVATAHFDHVRPGDRLHVDPSDPYVVGNRLFEAGFLVLEAPGPDAEVEAVPAGESADAPSGEPEPQLAYVRAGPLDETTLDEPTIDFGSEPSSE